MDLLGNVADLDHDRHEKPEGSPSGSLFTQPTLFGSDSDQTANDEPQPQVPLALGLLNLNPAPAVPST